MDLGHSGIPSVHPLEPGSVRFICDRAVCITTAHPCDTFDCQGKLQHYELTLNRHVLLAYTSSAAGLCQVGSGCEHLGMTEVP